MHCEKGNNDPPEIPSPTSKNKLESPSEQLVLLRKQIMVEKLLKKKSKSTPSTNSKPEEGSAGVRKTLKMGPSSILSRVKDFLPVMKTENEKLMLQVAQNPATVSLEVDVDSDNDQVGQDLDQPMVELNLALMPQEDEKDSDSSSDPEEEDDLNLHRKGQQKSLENGDTQIVFRDEQTATISVAGGEKKVNSKKLIEEVNQEGTMHQE